jgi:hypothetical protein
MLFQVACYTFDKKFKQRKFNYVKRVYKVLYNLDTVAV